MSKEKVIKLKDLYPSYYLLRFFKSEKVRLTLSAAACIIFIAFALAFFLPNVTVESFTTLFQCQMW